MSIPKELLELLEQQLKYQRGAQVRLADLSRKYARMKMHGTYIDHHGCSCSVHFSEREPLTKQYADELLRQAEEAYAEDALVGKVISEVTGSSS